MAERFQPAGFCWSVFLCLVLAVLKLTVKAHWSWGESRCRSGQSWATTSCTYRSDWSGFTSLMTARQKKQPPSAKAMVGTVTKSRRWCVLSCSRITC